MKNSGQMLIEVVVAIGILALVLLGITDLMTRSASLVTYQKDREKAYAIARSTLNTYRENRDTGLKTYLSDISISSNGDCLDDPGYYCVVTSVQNKVGEEVLSVTLKAEVSWGPGKKFKVVAEEILTKK